MASLDFPENNKVTIEIYPQFRKNIVEREEILRGSSTRRPACDDYRVEAHEEFFSWKRDDEQKMERMLKWTSKRIFVQSDQIQQETGKYYWINIKPIILTGITSRQRILFMRDLTERLRDECYASKAFHVKFKLGNTEFDLKLYPTRNQPGNGVIWMNEMSHPHWLVEDRFECFRMLYARDINKIINDARVNGIEITGSQVSRIQPQLDGYEPYNRSKKQILEELNFVMLLYDFEVARRLQRPMTEDSKSLDILPIGLGVALLHRMQKTGNGDLWEFYSSMFKGNATDRGNALEAIIFQFQQMCQYPLNQNILMDELYYQFG